MELDGRDPDKHVYLGAFRSPHDFAGWFAFTGQEQGGLALGSTDCRVEILHVGDLFKSYKIGIKIGQRTCNFYRPLKQRKGVN